MFARSTMQHARTRTRTAGAARQRLVRQRAILTNRSSESFRVARLELALPTPAEADEVLDLTGRWLLERVPQRRPSTSVSGCAPHAAKPGSSTPCCLPRCPRIRLPLGAGVGDAPRVERQPGAGAPSAPRDTLASAAASESLLPGEVVLALDESYTTPWLYGSWGDGLDAFAARFHRHLRIGRAVRSSRATGRAQHVGGRRLRPRSCALSISRSELPRSASNGSSSTTAGSWDVETTRARW